MSERILAQGKTVNDSRTQDERCRFRSEDGKLIYSYDGELLEIQPWGRDSFRVRATKNSCFDDHDWALTEEVCRGGAEISIDRESGTASIVNGRIRAVADSTGYLEFYGCDGKLVLKEYVRNRSNILSLNCSALEIEAREFRPIPGGDYALTMRFESLSEDEKIFGMGQYQQPYLNLKGAELELAHRNSQASVPFMLSSLGYGLLWNNPAIGSACFGKNIMSFRAEATRQLDYWVTVGETPSDIEENYAAVSGKVPMMPGYAMGLWQSKLRYQTQEELLEVARKYRSKGIPLSVIVCDFFHWPYQGEWKFDPVYWPNPDAMIRELKEMGIELMVSVWPTVDYRSENFQEMLQKGYLVRTDRGFRICMDYMGNTVHYDATNPGAREYVWNKAKQNYYSKGVRIFWLDEAEPEYSVYSFDNYRYYLGTDLQVGNIYPALYAKGFYDGMSGEGQENIINLLRCAWAGSQKYGALVWSGDIHSSFESLRNQYAAGLNMGIAGIPWWTTDIGGFHGGWVDDPEFHELFIRWFEYGLFCPVMRIHGDREPHKPQFGTTGGAACLSGADNEIWSYGEEVERILTPYVFMREKMKGYLSGLMQEAHEKGTPVMRPLFYDFPHDGRAWDEHIEEYMFGPDILVAPILYKGARKRSVYLPEGASWTDYWTGVEYSGGTEVEVDAPIDRIPFFFRNGRKVF